MKKHKLLIVLILLFGFVSLSSCNDTTYIYDSINDKSEDDSLIEKKSSSDNNTESSQEEILSTETTTDSNNTTNTSNTEESSNDSKENDNESDGKIKNEGTLDDGIKWGPLED